GWLDESTEDQPGTLSFTAGPIGGRVEVYTGERQGVPLVIHGPFVGETREDLMRVSRAYMDGTLPRVSAL
ncbi:MAG TPA: hypothetical protein VFO55_04005, partial [Gemmatimonadaceae bacterium]|nr:hypothetical protein [Gemmatimonadaceae bacterium]